MARSSLLYLATVVILAVACSRSSRWVPPSACKAFRFPASADSGSSGDSVVEQRPWVISHPELDYPTELRAKRITGHVLVEVIVDTAGRAEIPSIKALSASDSAFIWPSFAAVMGARFCPGVLGGRRVRVTVQVPINFSNLGDVRRAPS